jgi:hypothetical protein
MEAVKRCTKCGIEKPLTDFFSRKGATDGKMSSCKSCKTEATYKWRESNREKWNSYVNELNQTPKYKSRRSEYRSAQSTKDRANLHRKEKRKTEEWKIRTAAIEKSERVVRYRSDYKKRPERRIRTSELAKRPHVLERARLSNARKLRTAKGSIDNRMSTGIRRAINKGRTSWVALVGYTCLDLMRHLEKQFSDGMGWHNFGEWHIDHIIPKSKFSYSSASDPDFIASGHISLK